MCQRTVYQLVEDLRHECIDVIYFLEKTKNIDVVADATKAIAQHTKKEE